MSAYDVGSSLGARSTTAPTAARGRSKEKIKARGWWGRLGSNQGSGMTLGRGRGLKNIPENSTKPEIVFITALALNCTDRPQRRWLLA